MLINEGLIGLYKFDSDFYEYYERKILNNE